MFNVFVNTKYALTRQRGANEATRAAAMQPTCNRRWLLMFCHFRLWFMVQNRPLSRIDGKMEKSQLNTNKCLLFIKCVAGNKMSSAQWLFFQMCTKNATLWFHCFFFAILFSFNEVVAVLLRFDPVRSVIKVCILKPKMLKIKDVEPRRGETVNLIGLLHRPLKSEWLVPTPTNHRLVLRLKSNRTSRGQKCCRTTTPRLYSHSLLERQAKRTRASFITETWTKVT